MGLQRFVHEWETEQQGYISTYGVLFWKIQLIFYNKGSQFYCIHCSVFHPVWLSLSFNIFCQCNCSYAVCLITQSYPTLSNPMECSPPGSSVHGILQQEYWSGLPFPPPGDLLNPEIESGSLAPPVLAGGFLTTTLPGKPFSTSLAISQGRGLPSWAFFFLYLLLLQSSLFHFRQLCCHNTHISF